MSQDMFREEPRGDRQAAPLYQGLALVRPPSTEEDTPPELLLVHLHSVPDIQLPAKPLEATEPQKEIIPVLETPDVPTDSRKRANLSKLGKIGLRATAALFAVAAPVTAGLHSVETMQPTHTSVVGLETTSSVGVGQDSSSLDTGVSGSLMSSAHRNALGINFGMNISVHGEDLDLGDSTTRNALGEIFSRPEPEIDRIVSETTADARDEFLLESGKVLGYELLAAGLVFGSRRFFGARGELLSDDQQQMFYRWFARPVVAAFFAGAVIAPAIQGAEPLLHQSHNQIVADSTFDGTAMQGMQLKGLIHSALPTIINGFQPSEKLNDVTSQNALNLIASRPDLQPQEGWTNWLQVDDLQDRSSMAQQAGVAAKALNVKFILLSGDESTITQIGFGSYIMDTVRHYSGETDTWLVDGDHDTSRTNYYASLDGFHVADNKTRDVGGIPMLLLNSISISTLGVNGIPTVDREPGVDSEKWITDALKEIQESNPQVVSMHDYKAAIDLAKAAIIAGHPIPFIDAGRSFKQLGPITVNVPGHKGSTVVFVSGSSGGHNNTSPEFGNIPIPSPVNLFSRNDTTGQVNVVTITYHPDGTVTASQPTEIVAPQEESTVTSAGADARHDQDKAEAKAAAG
jgi:hypothetical protein